MGCTPSAPHQCPLASVASYLIYADVRNLNDVTGTNHVSEHQKELSRSIVPFVKEQMMMVLHTAERLQRREHNLHARR